MTSVDHHRRSSPSNYFSTLREKQITPTASFQKKRPSDTPQFSHRIVVAVDFGTTYSGYAYSFTSEPEQVIQINLEKLETLWQP